MPTAELSLKRDKNNQFVFEPELLLSSALDKSTTDHLLNHNNNDKSTNTTPPNDSSCLKMELDSEQDSHEDNDEDCEYFVSEVLEHSETRNTTYTLKDNQITLVSATPAEGHSNHDMVILFLTE